MKRLLFLSFLLNVSCLDPEKLDTEEEDEEDEDEEPRREGDIEGDCLDGIDNDEDGYIDCEDQGCDGKPACQDDTDIDEPSSEPSNEPSEEPSDEPLFTDMSGQINYTIDYGPELEEEGFHYDCLVSDILTPYDTDPEASDICYGCTIFGEVDIERVHNCYTWSLPDRTMKFGIIESTQTLQHFTYTWDELYPEEECNISRTIDLTDSSMTIECIMDIPAPDIPAYRQTIHLSLTW